MAVVLIVMFPAPENVSAFVPDAMPPLMFKFPLVEPIVAAAPSVIRPVSSLVPAKFSIAPPLLIPVLLMVKSSARLTPFNCTAPPLLLFVLLVTTVLLAAAPSAPALDTRMAPALIVITPV